MTPGTIKHNFQYEVSYRDIIAAKQASFRVREQCGPSLKSALRHILSIDRRDDTIFPTGGSHVQFTTELAGLGGDIGFMKYDLMLQSNWTPHEFFVCNNFLIFYSTCKRTMLKCCFFFLLDFPIGRTSRLSTGY